MTTSCFSLSIGYIYISTIIVVTLPCLLHPAGNHQLVCSTRTLEAVEGENFSVQCHVCPDVNLSAYTVDVKRRDLPVDEDLICSCRGGRENLDDQSSRYRKRASLNCGDLSRGLTLQISSLQQSDSGSYKIYVPKLQANFTFNLTVVNESSTTRPPAGDGTETNEGDPPKTELPWPVVISIIAVVVVVATLYLLKKLIRFIRQKMKPRVNSEDTEQNGCEMKNLMDQTTEGGGLRCSSPQ